MNEERLLAYLSLIQELLDCPSGEENQILNQHPELLDGAFVQVCEQVAEQLQSDGQENNAGFLRNLAQEVGAFLARQGTGENQQEVLQQFWQQLLKAQMQGGIAAVHQVMRQNMGLIVPNLGDTIVQSIPGLLAQNPDQAERVAGLVGDTCTSIRLFPYGRYAEALEIAIRGYGVVLELRADNPEKRAQTLTNLGSVRSTQAIMGINPAANLESAITSCDQAAGIMRRLGLDKDLSSTLNNLGIARSTQAQMGINPAANLDRAIAAYDEAAEIRRRLKLDKDLSSTLNNLGIARRTQAQMGINPAANLDRAIAAYDEAAEIRRRLELEKDLSSTLTNLGVARLTQAEMGINPAANLDRAIAAYDEAAEIRRRLKLEKDLSSTLTNLGNARSTQAQMGINPAANLDSAIAAYDEAAEIRRRLGLDKDLSQTLTNLGSVRSTQAIMGINPAANLDSAIAAYDEAAEIGRRLGLARDLAITLNNFGFAYQAQSRLAGNSSTQTQQALENAYRSFQEALERVEYLRGEIGADSEGYKRNFNEEWNRVYRGMVEVCLELGRYQDAIEYVDRSKARNLVELIATRDAYPGRVMPENDRQQLQQLKIDIAQAERRIQDEENPDPTHLKQLRQQKRELEPYKPLHFQGMQELLDKETAILEWYILGDKFLTFTLMPDPSLTLHSEGGEQEADPSEPPFLRGAGGIKIWTSSEEDLDKLIDWTNQYRNAYYQAQEALQVALAALKAAKTEQEQQKADELWAQAQDIWQNPLAQRLETLAEILHLPEILQNLFKEFPNCKKLILIPHRYLHLFPLHALPIPTGESKIKSLQELFEQGVTYAPNCQLLQQAQTRHRPNFKRLFAVQNPNDNLSFADLEVETIGGLFLLDPNSLQKGKATKANFLAKDLRQTHHLFFSCHAGFNRESPLDSGLELADDILTLEEIIASLNLSQCSLVTLSACETGQVAIDDTDEYISLSSGFILAGSPSVLVSLWSVNQVSTALLLIKTYETLQNHPGQIAIALKTAQIWLRDTTVKGFQVWVEKCQLLEGGDWQKPLAEFFQQLGQNEKGVNDRPYQSPYHWAAFCVVGQGEQKMASDSDKIQAFTDLLSNNLLADYLPDLEELKSQLGDDDEKNAEAIDQWLNNDQRKSILTAYHEQLKSITSINPLLGETGEKGFGGSTPNPKPPSPSLPKLIDNITKDPTKLPKNPEENPPQS
ncbi:CHAT domain-containing protein [Planktothrix paucivesiculata]|uniref:TPR repeat protein n=1 Tax=Planktothrix paucivesiculata PCC 9631 TaxID=671071 RepID=A0A7Z9BJ80_9CYAN|nr:CHAT domain-containing protein [Planktothrix paucivesiculata]VXD12893.1 TPR repeat protein [Planktothrix paucivesiculata PCC 9631]